MSNPSKQKGTTWERQCATYMEPVWPSVERAPLWGVNDKGDLVNTGEFTVECKNVKSITLAQFVHEANVESRNAGTEFGVAFIKRRGKTDPGEGYAVMDVETFRAIVARLNERSES